MENKNIRKMLDDEYAATLQAVSDAQAGTEEAKWQLQKLESLHKQRVNEDSAVTETEKVKESKKDRIAKYVINGAGVLVSVVELVATCIWLRKGMQFEETGTYTSKTRTWISSNFKLFKRK